MNLIIPLFEEYEFLDIKQDEHGRKPNIKDDNRIVYDPKFSAATVYVYEDDILIDIFDAAKIAAKAFKVSQQKMGLYVRGWVNTRTKYDGTNKPDWIPDGIDFKDTQQYKKSEADITLKKYRWGAQRGYTTMIMQTDKAKKISKGRDIVAVENERINSIVKKFHEKGVKYRFEVGIGEYLPGGKKI